MPFSKRFFFLKQAVIVVFNIYNARNAVSLCRAAEILIHSSLRGIILFQLGYAAVGFTGMMPLIHNQCETCK